MSINWRSAARNYLIVIAIVVATVALVVTIAWGYLDPLKQFCYSLTIGTITWGVIEFGRYFIDPRHCYHGSASEHGFPKGWRAIALTSLGVACGYLLGGKLIGDTLFNPNIRPDYDPGLSSIITLVFTAIIGGGASFYFYLRDEGRGLSAQMDVIAREAEDARLKLLESQLKPHMLFNTLAGVRELAMSDPPRAVANIDRLSNYLRLTLTGSLAETHTLTAEFALLTDYLELMQMRMGSRLRYRLELPDDLRDAPVPPLLLQPMVENSVRHGLEPKIEGGEITVRVRREDRHLIVEIEDDGVGLDEAALTPRPLVENASGFGLHQVRRRLTSIYGKTATLDLLPAPNGGTRAVLVLPEESGARIK